METRVIDVSGRFLSGLDKSQAVIKWTIENKHTLERHLEGYDELIGRLNEIPDDSPRYLTEFFVRSNREGGLGWLNEQKVVDFRRRILPENS